MNFHAKNCQNSTLSIIVDFVLRYNHDFWRENSNYQGKPGIFKAFSKIIFILAQKFDFAFFSFFEH